MREAGTILRLTDLINLCCSNGELVAYLAYGLSDVKLQPESARRFIAISRIMREMLLGAERRAAEVLPEGDLMRIIEGEGK